MRPTFEGSDRYTATPLPLLSVRWRDTISIGDGGLSAYWHHKRFRIGGGLTFDSGRKDHGSGGIFESGDDRLKGLGTINAALGFRGFVSYGLGPANFELSATKFTGSQNDGVLASFGVSAPLPLTKRLIVMPHIRASWASTDSMQTYFGVTPVQAAASIFPAFNARSGPRDVRGGANLIYRLNAHWFLDADTSVHAALGRRRQKPHQHFRHQCDGHGHGRLSFLKRPLVNRAVSTPWSCKDRSMRRTRSRTARARRVPSHRSPA